jgi:hypothetical protein
MKIRSALLGAAFAGLTLLGSSTGASAVTLTYVGSWEVDQGPYWPSVPPAYTGQQAAALLFGGSAGQYVTSTIDSLPGDANFKAWISTWGGACGGNFPCGTAVASNYGISTGGLYQNPGDTSAYVRDWAIGPQYTNYAFKVSGVPETSTWVMMLAGFAGLGFLGYRRNKAATLAA